MSVALPGYITSEFPTGSVPRLLLACLVFQAALQTPPPASPAGNQTPGNVSPPTPGAPDPSAVTFSTDFGLLIVAIHPTKTADYEAVIVALQDALAKSEDANTRAMAHGWRVFKAAETDAKSNVLYVHVLQPAMRAVDYRPSIWLDKLLAGAPPNLLAKYRDAFAGAPSKLGLVEFAHMSVTPVAKPK